MELYELDILEFERNKNSNNESNPMPYLQRNYMPYIDHVPVEFQEDLKKLIDSEAAYFTIDQMFEEPYLHGLL